MFVRVIDSNNNNSNDKTFKVFIWIPKTAEECIGDDIGPEIEAMYDRSGQKSVDKEVLNFLQFIIRLKEVLN